MTAIFKVLGVGAPIVDLLVNVTDAYIDSIEGDKGGMELVDHDNLDVILNNSGADAEKVPGGSAGNTIFGLAKLNVKTAFLGKVGKDPDGEFYTRRLAELGGDTACFRYNDSVYTGRCLSLITPDSERTMRTDLGAAATIGPDDVTPELFEGVTHVHLEGYAIFAEDYFMKVLKTAKAAGCTVSFDLASFEVVKIKMDILPDVLKNYVDIVFANEDEANVFCGDLSPEDQALKLNEYCDIAAVKLGKDGCCIAKDGKVERITTTPVKAVDTTGAGDLWQAGFIYGVLDGRSMESCAKCGNVLGAEVVQVIGAEIPASRWDDIKAKFKQV